MGASTETGLLPSMNYQHIFNQAIERLHGEGRYRVFIDILRNKGAFPNARCFAGHNGPKPITVWCSNDYLAMGQHPKVIAAMEEALIELSKTVEKSDGSEGVELLRDMGNEHRFIFIEKWASEEHHAKAFAALPENALDGVKAAAGGPPDAAYFDYLKS